MEITDQNQWDQGIVMQFTRANMFMLDMSNVNTVYYVNAKNLMVPAQIPIMIMVVRGLRKILYVIYFNNVDQPS